MFKVMLAGNIKKEQEENIEFPVYASPKIDGVRMYVKDSTGYSRSNKTIPNKHVQSLIKNFGDALEGFDGELVVGLPNDPDVYNKTSGAVRREASVPDVHFCVFDYFTPTELGYEDRFWQLRDKIKGSKELASNPFIELVEPELINNLQELEDYERKILAMGYEGVILRSISGTYKLGRSTFNEGGMLKLKRFIDSEAEIVGYEELMHNNNPATINELGRTTRSSHKENLVGSDMLGALVCKTSEGVSFKIGTGFTEEQRYKFWCHRETLIGKFAKFKYFPAGVKVAPRHPVFLGFRETWDMPIISTCY